jgi:hypothetical protein
MSGGIIQNNRKHKQKGIQPEALRCKMPNPKTKKQVEHISHL